MCTASAPDRVGRLANQLQVFDDAEEVGRLHRDAAGVLGSSSKFLSIESPVRTDADRYDLEAGRLSVGVENGPVDRVHRFRDDHSIAFAAKNAMGEQGRLDKRGCTVVQGGVGDLHARESGHQGLELEESLQGSLRDLRLVRGIRGEELGPRENSVDRGGLYVPVDARTEKAR